ncbi:hypothetical protein Xsto_04069 [Xenorhabdus stockiae]|uniref:Uncharacterized protein n=1 Tax=Xenorhabdus stockiae TaxID=351614 RepID=A0A2D0K6X0_9GAMM|nr:hypothetical protein [Xenorhabdus stockiae]PHM59123.1 hypothetical protein Xsto_04069 [Xenorhabdus stockiae]
MNNDVIELAREIENLQVKAAMELSNSWIIERLLLANAAALCLLEKGDKEQAMAWMEGLFDWAEEDLLSEAESNSDDLDGWVNKRMESEVSTIKALEIIRSETPAVEKIKNSLEELAKKLAEYENMKPVAIYNIADGEVYKSIHDIGDNKSILLAPLYRHPNK